MSELRSVLDQLAALDPAALDAHGLVDDEVRQFDPAGADRGSTVLTAHADLSPWPPGDSEAQRPTAW